MRTTVYINTLVNNNQLGRQMVRKLLMLKLRGYNTHAISQFHQRLGIQIRSGERSLSIGPAIQKINV